MGTLTCPSCGHDSALDEFTATSTTRGWMPCGSCDHVWQRLDAPADSFSLIVGSTSVGMSGWEHGTTVNISQSGTLYRCERPVPARIAVEVLVELTASPGATGSVALVRCEGQTVPPARPGARSLSGERDETTVGAGRR